MKQLFSLVDEVTWRPALDSNERRLNRTYRSFAGAYIGDERGANAALLKLIQRELPAAILDASRRTVGAARPTAKKILRECWGDANSCAKKNGTHEFSGMSVLPALLAARLFGSIALLPLVALQGEATRRRLPRLPSAKPPHRGTVSGIGPLIRVLAIGESSVSGVGLARGDETVAAATARSLARITKRPVAWRANGLSGATVKEALDRLLPCVTSEPADLLIVAFGVNDVLEYRSPWNFADDLVKLVSAARARVGEAAVVIGGVAPLNSFPALPWPLRSILGWRSEALQVVSEQLTGRLPRLVVERFSARLEPDLFAIDGFHPNVQAHTLWGEEIAALALPLLECAGTIPGQCQGYTGG